MLEGGRNSRVPSVETCTRSWVASARRRVDSQTASASDNVASSPSGDGAAQSSVLDSAGSGA